MDGRQEKTPNERKEAKKGNSSVATADSLLGCLRLNVS